MFEIDWQQAWFRGFEVHGQAIVKLWHDLGSLPMALNRYAEGGLLDLDADVSPWPSVSPLRAKGVVGLPRFVPQAQLPTSVAYESFIYDTHCVPTRENLHDFFNALCWFRYPLTKAYLNAEQAKTLKRLGPASERGALRDALTLLDENACFVWCESEMWHALQKHDWLDAFWRQRDAWASVRVELFGHALLEKLCKPYKAITAHAVHVQPVVAHRGVQGLQEPSDAWRDAQMLSALRSLNLSSKPFQALPVLGVPGWSLDNAQLSFYEDDKVFRPKKQDTLRQKSLKSKA